MNRVFAVFMWMEQRFALDDMTTLVGTKGVSTLPHHEDEVTNVPVSAGGNSFLQSSPWEGISMKSLRVFVGLIAFLSPFAGLSGCVPNPLVGGIVDPEQAIVATQSASSSFPAVRPPTRNRHTKHGQMDYSQDLQTAMSVCNSQAQQEYMNSAKTSSAVQQIAGAVSAFAPGAYNFSHVSAVAGGLMATQGMQRRPKACKPIRRHAGTSICESAVGSRIGDGHGCAHAE